MLTAQVLLPQARMVNQIYIFISRRNSTTRRLNEYSIMINFQMHFIHFHCFKQELNFQQIHAKHYPLGIELMTIHQ